MSEPTEREWLEGLRYEDKFPEAGDGGRAPDVSEQRAEALYTSVERGATALCRFVFPGYIVPRIEMARAVIDAYNDGREGWMDRLPPKQVLHGPLGSDPASVLAALLAESPDATAAAIEALLTSEEAVEAAADALATRLVDPTFGPTHFQLKMRERDRAQVATSAAVRSLLSKTPKEDGESDEGGNQ